MVAWRAAMEGVAASHWDEAGAEQPRWRRRIAEEIESSGNRGGDRILWKR
jgi:hypothetical protein